MIKIIAGRLKGRKILTFTDKHYRPSQAKFKEGLFSILSSGTFSKLDILQNAKVLDLFCGTGSLGFEALSRGAAHCTMVDIVANNLDLIHKTAIQLHEQDNISCLKLDASKLPAASNMINQPFDLVFIDPPYFKGLVELSLKSLHQRSWLAPHAVIVIELAKSENLILSTNYKLIIERVYGNSKLIIVSYNNE